MQRSSPSAAPSRDPEPADFGRFFLSGPTEVRPEVLREQVRPVIGHRGDVMQRVVRRMQPVLQRVFGTARPVYVSTSSATGFMEAAIRNGVRRRVLCLVNGAFSARFHKIARACGVDADTLDVVWGEAHAPERVERALRDGDYDAVTAAHSETSTGVLNPIGALADAVRAAGGDDVVFLVDSVSGIGGARFDADAWGVDFVLTGSQKALALPPGLAFGVASERMLRRARERPERGLYFDLLAFEDKIRKHQTPNTPAVTLLYSAAAQTARIEAEGVEARWARHATMARKTWEWVGEMRGRGIALEVLAPEGARSPTVTCIRLPEGRTGPEVAAAMRESGYTIASGYGKLKPETIRIGHMGDHTPEELDALLGALERVLGE